MNAMDEILDSAAILDILPLLLPKGSKQLSNQQDALSVLIHTIMTIIGFRLVAIDDATPAHVFERNVLPDNWNKKIPGMHIFRYQHEQSSLEFLIKISKLASRTVINGIALLSDEIATLDVSTDDFVSHAFFPREIEGLTTSSLAHAFIGSHHIADFVIQYKLKILQKLAPDLRKEDYVKDTNWFANPIYTTSSTQLDQSTQSLPPPAHSSITSQNSNWPLNFRPRSSLEIGRQDLDPIPLQTQHNFFTRNQSSGDGMFLGPNHPFFRGANEISDRNVYGRGPWGGDGYLPYMGAPPGARFDPIVPSRSRDSVNARNSTQLGDPGTDSPDNDEFLPPDFSDNMFL